ncbi:exopolysaccharide biosynthesis polyprenyl glycosylphosphotransferase [Devosia sp. ZB163]|uniref:exopolysaccharide biosynthesis polyprenyl glycosylphosphotransferase n=1 Tax=Devosia sp. ZB163 TaxID=3025938 RepID=UPI00235EB453|nr:exopolysaccharide biosynthesis polyprenyl glycosylphosphotransferase [Devosia sp. ZB163]MDC9826315.1 exopolysaccharide biosynthesis polyprenyl glycosylphosphotransferase [Devosia sp. ZB163]
MSHTELGYQGIERRRARRVVANQAVLCTGFALGEGALAALAMLVPALFYHGMILNVPLGEIPFALYGIYSSVLGVLYGAFSAVSANQFLDRAQHPHTSLAQSVLGWTAAFAIALFGAFFLGVADELSRVSLIVAYVLGVPVLLLTRTVAYAAITSRIRAGRLQFQKVAVVGSRADTVRFLLNGNLWKTGYRLAGTLYLEEAVDADGNFREGAIVEFARHWVAGGAEFIVFVGEIGDIDGLEKLTNELKRFAINVVCVPATDNVSFKFLDVVPLGPNNALRSLRKPMSDGAVLAKRIFDVAGAGLGLLLLSPLFAAVALLIKLDSDGPVFYRQERRGFNGRTFHIWKFRSMTVTESGRKMTQARVGDKRITRIGAFIRRTSIDELPQLINVLSGEMSLVGPRPHALMHDDELGEQLASYAHRQRIKPGISGWAQVNGYRGETSTFEQIEGRTRHDLYYIDNWSIFLDCWIIVLTVFSSKTRRNAV